MSKTICEIQHAATEQRLTALEAIVKGQQEFIRNAIAQGEIDEYRLKRLEDMHGPNNHHEKRDGGRFYTDEIVPNVKMAEKTEDEDMTDGNFAKVSHVRRLEQKLNMMLEQDEALRKRFDFLLTKLADQKVAETLAVIKYGTDNLVKSSGMYDTWLGNIGRALTRIEQTLTQTVGNQAHINSGIMEKLNQHQEMLRPTKAHGEDWVKAKAEVYKLAEEMNARVEINKALVAASEKAAKERLARDCVGGAIGAASSTIPTLQEYHQCDTPKIENK